MRDYLRKLMYGRYGVDQFSLVLMTTSIGFTVLGLLFRSQLMNFLSTVFIIYALFRTFSKNFPKRQKENTSWLYLAGISNKFFNRSVRRLKDFPHYKYYKCMNCKQTIRVPRGKGKVEIRCPKCGYSFRSKT